MRKYMMSGSLLIGLLLAIFFTVAPARTAPQSKPKTTKAGAAMTYGNSDSITEEEMKIYDYFLASDQLEGRYLPSRGYDTAALYVASNLAEWNLKPGGSTTGTNGPLQPYFMPFELVSHQVDPAASKASITGPAFGGRGGRGGGGGGGARGGNAAAAPPVTTDYEYGKDWTVAAGGRGAPPVEALEAVGNLVFAGNGYVINKTNTDPYAGQDVNGKIVVVAGLPPELAALQAAAGRGGRGGGAGPESTGHELHGLFDARRGGGKERRSGSRHNRELSATHCHGQSERRIWRTRRTRPGAQRNQLFRGEVSDTSRVPGCSRNHRGHGNDQ